ncbi:MAG: DUF4114 domain-containing protein [Oscillatoriales cyanobacterium]|nr:MAG: DUF4114 domain-containing protein [Oscillatoriales cyanobacterium]
MAAKSGENVAAALDSGQPSDKTNTATNNGEETKKETTNSSIATAETTKESNSPTNKPITAANPFTSGKFVVDSTGKVSIDYLLDGGFYRGQLAIISLKGMEKFVPGSAEFLKEAAGRALSNSEKGHIVIDDLSEGARFSGNLPEGNFNEGSHLGVKTFAMTPGDEFGFMLVPNDTVKFLYDYPGFGGDKRPLFSMVTANPNEAFHLGQLADLTGEGNTFAMEDMRFDLGTDKDYNDIIFQVRGAKGKAALMDDVVNPNKDWRKTDLGKQVLDYATGKVVKDPVTDKPIAEPPVVKDPVTDKPIAQPQVVKDPVTDKPISEPPVVKDPVTDKPIAEPPVVKDPVTDKPISEPPVVKDPVTDKPISEPPEPQVVKDPVTDKPISEPQVVKVPVTDKPISEPPVVKDAVQDRPIADEPNIKNPVQDRPIADEPNIKNPVQDKPISELSVVKNPVQDKPISELSVVKNPVQDKSISDEPIIKGSVQDMPPEAEPTVKHKIDPSSQKLAVFSAPISSSSPNSAPVVTASNQTVNAGASISPSFSVSDANGDRISNYYFSDLNSSSTSGYFTINGVKQTKEFTILAEQLSNVRFVGGSVAGTDSVSIAAYDGKVWR